LVLMAIVPIDRLSGSRWVPQFRELRDVDDDLVALIAARRRSEHQPGGENGVPVAAEELWKCSLATVPLLLTPPVRPPKHSVDAPCFMSGGADYGIKFLDEKGQPVEVEIKAAPPPHLPCSGRSRNRRSAMSSPTVRMRAS
jgi:hypothetical protein